MIIWKWHQKYKQQKQKSTSAKNQILYDITYIENPKKPKIIKIVKWCLPEAGCGGIGDTLFKGMNLQLADKYEKSNKYMLQARPNKRNKYNVLRYLLIYIIFISVFVNSTHLQNISFSSW